MSSITSAGFFIVTLGFVNNESFAEIFIESITLLKIAYLDNILVESMAAFIESFETIGLIS